MALAADKRTQGEVAHAAGVDEGQVSRWKGGAIPKLDGLVALVGELGVSLHWLVTGDGPMYPASGEDTMRLEVIGRIARREVRARELAALEGSTRLPEPGDESK